MIHEYSDSLRRQLLLALAGFSPGAIDGVQGPQTQAAIDAFRLAGGLAPDGVDAALADAISSPGLKALFAALPDLGYVESPPGSNRTKFGVWFGHDGIPWCNLFVSYHLLTAGGFELCHDFQAPGVRPGRGCAYVPSTLVWLQKTGRAYPASQGKPGDLAIYDWQGDHQADHIGFFATSPDSSGRFMALEGNTSDASDSNGGQVLLRPRQTMHVVAAGRC